MSFKTVDGAAIDLNKYKGKVVALEFLITTCPHCQRCSRILQKMQNEFGPQGFQALGVATNEMAHMLIPDYVKNQEVRFPVGWATREQSHEFLQHPTMLIMYVPQLVFIDRKGTIRAQFGGNDEFFKNEEPNVREQITKLLAEGSGGPRASAGNAVSAVKKK